MNEEKMMITTGVDFQGYFITDYIDVIFDEMIMGIGLFKGIASKIDNDISVYTGTEATIMSKKLNSVKTELRNRVIKKAQDIGANALIGVDFESSKVGDLLMVSMTATAVKVDRIAEGLPRTEKIFNEEERAKREEEKRIGQIAKLERLKDEVGKGEDTIQSLVRVIEEIDNPFEIQKYMEEQAGRYPEIITKELLTEIQKRVDISRVYGKNSAKMVETIKEWYEISD